MKVGMAPNLVTTVFWKGTAAVPPLKQRCQGLEANLASTLKFRPRLEFNILELHNLVT